MADHGSVRNYHLGCRCTLCREANTVYCRAGRERKLQGIRLVTPAQHGSATKYRSGCRCDACRNAHRLDRQRYPQKKRTPKGGYTQPDCLYLIFGWIDEAPWSKVGITHEGSTRLREHARVGWYVYRMWKMSNVRKAESRVKEYTRQLPHLPVEKTLGHTETFPFSFSYDVMSIVDGMLDEFNSQLVQDEAMNIVGENIKWFDSLEEHSGA